MPRSPVERCGRRREASPAGLDHEREGSYRRGGSATATREYLSRNDHQPCRTTVVLSSGQCGAAAVDGDDARRQAGLGNLTVYCRHSGVGHTDLLTSGVRSGGEQAGVPRVCRRRGAAGCSAGRRATPAAPSSNPTSPDTTIRDGRPYAEGDGACWAISGRAGGAPTRGRPAVSRRASAATTRGRCGRGRRSRGTGEGSRDLRRAARGSVRARGERVLGRALTARVVRGRERRVAGRGRGRRCRSTRRAAAVRGRPAGAQCGPVVIQYGHHGPAGAVLLPPVEPDADAARWRRSDRGTVDAVQGGEGQQRERPGDAVRHADVAVPAGEGGSRAGPLGPRPVHQPGSTLAVRPAGVRSARTR